MKPLSGTCLLVVSFLIVSYTSFCQERSVVTGQVLDSESHKPLQGATIMISHLDDSSSIGKTVCDKSGLFRLNNVVMNDSLLLRISYSGFEEFEGILVVTQKRFSLQPVLLHPEIKSLEGVTVKSTPRLMVVKGDTVEFKASNYKLAPNAMAQDLVRRLPGLTIDAQGKLFFNGRPVTTILVDGKVFFSSDGGIALNNIPVDMIDKIQVADTKTTEEKMLGETAKGNESTLNIKLKPGNKFFGNAAAGTGTDNRYETSGLAGITRGKQQLNLLAGINNTNSINSNINNDSKRSFLAITQGGGITKTILSGVGYNNTFKDQTVLEANYLLTKPVTYRETVLQSQQNILADSALSNSSVSGYYNKSITHSLDLKLSNDKKGFSFTSMLTNDLPDNSSQTTQRTMDSHGSMLNALSGNYESKNNSLNWVTESEYRKKFKKKGRLLYVGGRVILGHQHEHDFNTAATYFYKSNTIDSQSIIRQESDLISSNSQFIIRTRYLEPLTPYLGISMGNWVTYENQSTAKTTRNLDANNQPVGIDSLYSNAFHSFVVNNSSFIGLHYDKGAISLSGNVFLTDQYQYRADLSRQNRLSYSIIRALPNLIFNYTNAKDDRISLQSMSVSNNPTPDQLQPVQDNSNLFLIKKGNPALKPATTYQNQLFYRKMIPGKTAATLNAGLFYVPVFDQIVASVSYDSLARQIVQYKNVSGVYSAGLNIGGDITFKYGKNVFKISVTTLLNFTHDKQYVNELPFASSSQNIHYHLGINYSRGPVIDLSLFYNPATTSLHYKENAASARRYTTNSAGGLINFFLFKRFKWSNSINYFYNSDIAPGLKKNSTLWIANLSYLCLHNQKGEIKLTAFDILKQNRNINRVITASSITDTQTNNLQQYFLLGFVYHFGQIKK